MDLPLSHFLECKFAEHTEENFWEDFYYVPNCDSNDLEKPDMNAEKGCIIEYTDKNSNGDRQAFLYSPIF